MTISSLPIAGGWIKLHRQALANGWLRNHRLWTFWCYCLLKASHKPTSVLIGFQQVPLEPGQFVFGRDKAAAELGMTVKQVRTCLNSLKTASNLAVTTASKFSIITVVNWNSYQSTEDEEGHEKGHEGASKGPARGHIQEVKEVKKKSLPTKNPSVDSRLFSYWFLYAFEIVQGYAYNFESGKDGKILSSILKTTPCKELVAKACHFLTDPDRYPKTKAPTLSFLNTKINDYPPHINGKTEEYRALGIIPPEGINLEEWTPWQD